MAKLDHERFGHLRYRTELGWVGQIHLSRFAECRDVESDGYYEAATSGKSVDDLRARTRHARREQDLREGRFQLVICDSDEEGPTEAQQRALDLLIEHEADVLDAVLHWIVDVYHGGGYWTLEGFVRDAIGPSAETVDEIKACLRLESVVVFEDGMGTTVPITFHFSSSLDEEHGIEVSTIGTEVVDPLGNSDQPHPFARREFPAFPFDLPESVDAGEIEPSADAHRFVELRYGDRWSGVFVLDAGMRCVGVVSGSFPRPLSDPKEIQGVRALTALRRWFTSSRVQTVVLTSVGLANWLVGLPCLIIGWLYEPRLFWACLAIGLVAHAVYYLFHGSDHRLFGLASGLVVLSIAGLVYASRATEFGSDAHVTAVTDIFGSVFWWGTAVVAVLLGIGFVATMIGLRREFARDGLVSLTWSVGCAAAIAMLVLALVATSFWQWSELHLLWIVPASLAGSLAVFFATMVFMPSSESKKTPCPNCGNPLASPEAKQCLHCGEDWHLD